MLPEKTWKTESVLRLLLGVFSTWSVGILFVAALTTFNSGISQERTRLLSMIAMTLAFHGASIFWVKSFLDGENISWREAFGLRSDNIGRVVILGVIAGIVVIPVALALQKISVEAMTSNNFHPESQQVVQELQKTVSQVHQFYLSFVALIAAPIIEEILFRGILYPTIKQAGYPKLALWGTSIFFALTHQNIPAFLPLVFFAMILTLLYEETGNLLAPIVAHSCFNTANFVMLLFAEHFTNFNLP